MNIEEVVAAFRNEARNVLWPGESLDRASEVTRRSSVNGQMNFITAFALDESNADAAIESEMEHFAGLGQSFEWKVFSFDRPFDLLDRLMAKGFTIGEREAVLVFDLSEGVDVLAGDFKCSVERVKTLEQVAAFRKVAEEVFGKDYSFTANQIAEGVTAGRRGHDGYVATIDGEPVAVGRLYTNPESAFAGLYGGGTRNAFRGQGCYRATVAARAQDALDRGAKFLQVDALPTSLPILLKLGFVKIADTWPANPPD